MFTEAPLTAPEFSLQVPNCLGELNPPAFLTTADFAWSSIGVLNQTD